MKMILHILLKDLRRHRLEIAGFLLVCVSWAWQQAHPFGLEWMQQRELIPILLFGLWFLLTVRLVQGECLVGDREWWPTHPYRWPQLMAAKVLALILCLNLPLLIAQLYLLHHAKIPISWALVPGLVVLEGMFFVFFTFSAAVLASITASIVQWVITVVGLILAGIALSWLPWSKLPDGLSEGDEVAGWIGFGIVVPAMVLVLVWQFARRRETPARWLLGISLLTIPLCIFLSSTSVVRDIAYPQVHAASPVQLSISENGSGKREFRRIRSVERTGIAIPIVDRALDSDSIVKVDGYRTEFSGPGWHWQTEWNNRSITFTHASPGYYLEVEMPDEIVDKIAQGNTSVKMEVAFNVYQLGHAQMVDTRPNAFDVPGVGRCEWSEGRAGVLISLSGVACVAPMVLPPVWVVQVDAAGDACPLQNGDAPAPPGHFTYAVEFGGSEEPDPNPVRRFVLQPSPWIPEIPSSTGRNNPRKAYICRGTRFTVRTGRLVQRMRATFDLGDIGTEEPSPKQAADDDE